MKRYLMVLAILFSLLVGCEQDGSQSHDATGQFVRAGQLEVRVGLLPDPPQVGENTLWIEVSDQEGKTIDHAMVRAVAEMPAMGSMPAMRSAADITAKGGGRYEGDFELSIKGEWPLAIDIAWEDDQGRSQHVDLLFDMATGREGLTLVSGPPEGEIAYHTCSMHPSVKSATPGTCPICGMDLVPVMREEQTTGTVRVDEARRQAVGIKTGEVVRELFHFPLRLQGKITFDQTLVQDINLQYEGWVNSVKALEPGQRFANGEPLFSLYSPELYALQEAHHQSYRRNPASETVEASRERLLLAGVQSHQITRIEREGAQRYLPILAPTSLVLISSQLTEGAAIKKGQQVLQAASVERVWVEAFAYEQDWSLLQEGMQARVELANSAREYESQVALISPIIRGSSRSARVRLDLDNPKSELLPGQFADVWLYKKLGSQLLVPLDAVMVTGERRIVFKDLGQGRLKPVVVKTGYSDGDRIVIREGLEEGDRIVTSGVFLIAAESRLKLGPDSW